MTAEPLPYDFRSPARLSRERVRALHVVNEAFARQLSTVLSATVRAVVQTGTVSVTQTSYGAYVESLPNPTLMSLLRFDTLPGIGVLQLPMGIVMGVIDRLLGGPGGAKQPSRALSDIELGLIRGLVPQVVEELTHAFESIAIVHAEVIGIESDTEAVQVIGAAEEVVVATFDIRLGDQVAAATLCLALSTLKPALATVDARAAVPVADTRTAKADARAVEQRVRQVPIEVRVTFREVGLTSSEVFSLAPGDVVPLRQSVDEPLLVSAGGIPVGHATPGSNGRRLAVQIVPPPAESNRTA